jgi:4-amino-4-deoxy-L-arabinose transferase-like glycosyltransferase
MNNELISRFKYLLLIIIVVLGFFLRHHNLNVWPRDGATFDEYAWTFLGISLINTGVPTSWSPHPQYQNKRFYQNPQGASFFLATPYLEHPPLFGLVAGSYAYLNGLHSFDDVSVSKVRSLSLVFGLISIVLVYFLAKEVFDLKTGLLASFIYAIAPTVVNGSKLVQNENFFIPLFLTSIYLSVRLGKRHHDSVFGLQSFVLYLILFLLPLAKVPWIAAAGAVAVIFIYQKKINQGLYSLAAGLGGILVYIVWGLCWNRELFINLMKLQLARYDLGYTSIFTLFTDPIVTDRLFIDGAIYAGWFSLFLLLTYEIKKTHPVLLGFLSYFSLYLFAIPSEPGHGWYRYPLYPFLIIFLAKIIADYFNKNFLVTGIILLVIGLPGLENALRPALGFSFPLYRLFLVSAGVGSLAPLIKINMNQTAKILNLVLAVIVAGLTMLAAIGYNEQ